HPKISLTAHPYNVTIVNHFIPHNPLSLHDALPIWLTADSAPVANADSYSTNEDTLLTVAAPGVLGNDSDRQERVFVGAVAIGIRDRKSTRLKSSHQITSYAVFCLKKKTPPNILPSS